MASRASISVWRRLSSSRWPSRRVSTVPRRLITSPGSSGSSIAAERRVVRRARHRGLDQPRQHPGGGQADGVGAVPGGGEVDDAELPAGDRVVHRRGPADPVVHDRRVVLGAEDHRRRRQPVGQVERVGADALVVPAAAGHEVDGLGLATHHPAAVGPQDAGLGVGDRHDQVAVLGGTPQLGLDAHHRGLQRGALPDLGRLGLVGQRRVGEVGGDRRLGAGPAAEDLGSHQLLGAVAALDEAGPGAHGVDPA